MHHLIIFPTFSTLKSTSQDAAEAEPEKSHPLGRLVSGLSVNTMTIPEEGEEPHSDEFGGTMVKVGVCWAISARFISLCGLYERNTICETSMLIINMNLITLLLLQVEEDEDEEEQSAEALHSQVCGNCLLY